MQTLSGINGQLPVQPHSLSKDYLKSEQSAPAIGQPEEKSVDLQILQATLLRSAEFRGEGVKALKLLYQTAVEGINEWLQPAMGDNAIQQAYQQGIDVSPEATAERIVAMSTGFFAAYSAQHPNEDPQQVLDNFMAVIRGGIEQGFAEAREILQGLQVLNGTIAANIDATYDLVQQGLDNFYQMQ